MSQNIKQLRQDNMHRKKTIMNKQMMFHKIYKIQLNWIIMTRYTTLKTELGLGIILAKMKNISNIKSNDRNG